MKSRAPCTISRRLVHPILLETLQKSDDFFIQIRSISKQTLQLSRLDGPD
jgi:hypothetical protein